VIVTVKRISEAFMLPAIQQLLEAFPFEILGLHADNSGEYINDTIAALLDNCSLNSPNQGQCTAMIMR
jgi:hypothetical protein